VTSAPRRAGWELGVELLAASRALFDELHARLAAQGHPDLRPAHGYAFRAIGAEGATASELARGLGVTKQAAGKMAAELAALGYVTRPLDPHDARRRPLVLTARGGDALERSAAIFDELRDEWARRAGAAELERTADALKLLTDLYGRPGALRPVW